jgi:galactitol PTS system EIIA component
MFNTKILVSYLSATDKQDVIHRLARVLEIQGYVSADYAELVMAREEKYPTGLPTEGVAVAIPHAGVESVFSTSIAVGVLEHPVNFGNMQNPEEELPVKLVFLLANKNTDEQLNHLKRLMECFSEPQLLKDLCCATSEQAVAEILNRYFITGTEPKYYNISMEENCS